MMMVLGAVGRARVVVRVGLRLRHPSTLRSLYRSVCCLPFLIRRVLQLYVCLSPARTRAEAVDYKGLRQS